MCGIIGMIGQTREDKWVQTHRILSHLLLAAEIRGRDATGFVAHSQSLERNGPRRTIIAKEAVPASKFVEANPIWRSLKNRRCSAVVAHVRLATHGDPSDPRNNHPFVSSGLALVHNGVISHYQDLVDRYCLKVDSECDSEVLLRIVERSKTVSIGLSLCLLERPGAIVIYDEHRDVCWLAHDDSRPLWVGRMRNDRRIWFASTSGILIDGIQNALQTAVSWEMLMPLAANHIFRASASGSIAAVFEDPVRPKSRSGQ